MEAFQVGHLTLHLSEFNGGIDFVGQQYRLLFKDMFFAGAHTYEKVVARNCCSCVTHRFLLSLTTATRSALCLSADRNSNSVRGYLIVIGGN